MDNQKIIDEIIKLEDKLQKCNKAYYDDNKSIISDYEYDLLKKKLIKLKEENKDILDNFNKNNNNGGLFGEENFHNANQVEKQVGYKANSKFAKITHKKRMMSLANALTDEEFDNFVEKTNRFLKINDFPESVCELKIDGLSFSAMYKYGRLEYVATRGDGIVGEDVSNNVLQIPNFPVELKYVDGTKIQPKELETFEVRGEIYMPKDTFEKLNDELPEDKKFSNPRNAASGTLRQLDASIVKERGLSYYTYFIGATSDKIVNNQADVLILLEKLGFVVNKHWKITKSVSEIKEFHEYIGKIRYELDCDIDGVVVKINSFDIQDKLGFTSTDPRWAIAYKFSGITAITKIVGIKNQVGRTGVITPVAELVPVNIGGVIVKRATLHNYDEIERLGIGINDEVVVKRAGDVIPKIVSLEKKSNNSKEIEKPVICPCCGEKLVNDSDYVAVVCNNHKYCKDQIIDRIRHFTSRDGFDITGLGKQNIICFYELGFLQKITDIFELKKHREDMIALDGFGEKSIDNLLNSIEEKKVIQFNKFLYALGIADVGENVAKIIATNYRTLDDLLEDKEEFKKIQNINGLGEKLITNLIKYFNNGENLEILKYLNNICKIKQLEVKTGKFSGKSVVFTGTLQTMTRQQAKIQAEELGFKVLTEISGNTNYLVCGEKAGSKLKRAQELNVEVLTEDDWKQMIIS